MTEINPEKTKSKEIAEKLGIVLPEGETLSAETLEEFTGNKGDDDDE